MLVTFAETTAVAETVDVMDEVTETVLDCVDCIDLEIDCDRDSDGLIVFEIVELIDGVNEIVSDIVTDCEIVELIGGVNDLVLDAVTDPVELADSDGETDDVTDCEPVELIDIDNDLLIVLVGVTDADSLAVIDSVGVTEADSLAVIDSLGVIEVDKVGLCEILEINDSVTELLIEAEFDLADVVRDTETDMLEVRETERVKVGVTDEDDGTPTVPAKL